MSDVVDSWGKAVQRKEVADAHREGERKAREVQRDADFTAALTATKNELGGQIASVKRDVEGLTKRVDTAGAPSHPIPTSGTEPISVPLYPPKAAHAQPNVELVNEGQRAKTALVRGLTVAVAAVSALLGAIAALISKWLAS